MKKIIGDKKVFALGVDILKYEPWIWGRTCLWVNNHQVGDFDDQNILGPFIGGLERIVIKHQELWYEELEGLKCKELFYKVFPFYNEPDQFYELSDEEQESYSKYDTFIFHFGENFDDWVITSVVRDNICKFLWVHTPRRDNDTYEVRNNIRCFDVPLKDVQKVYIQLCELIPDQYWPTLVEKLH